MDGRGAWAALEMGGEGLEASAEARHRSENTACACPAPCREGSAMASPPPCPRPLAEPLRGCWGSAVQRAGALAGWGLSGTLGTSRHWFVAVSCNWREGRDKDCSLGRATCRGVPCSLSSQRGPPARQQLPGVHGQSRGRGTEGCPACDCPAHQK